LTGSGNRSNFPTVYIWEEDALGDESLRQELEQISSAYAGSFNKRDGAGIAALFAKGGVHINPAGPRKDIEQFCQPIFEAGVIDHYEASLDEFWSLGSAVAAAIGQHRMTGKDQSGAQIERLGRWTATYVREGEKWKIKMLTALPRS
jgi:ketosteroid isomerase-like protein